MNNTISVSIAGVEVTYHVMETDAPKEYDGFGTFAISEVPNGDKPCTRTVMIRDEHYPWQTTRYSSGMHQFRQSDFAMEDVAEFLWRRLRGTVALRVVR